MPKRPSKTQERLEAIYVHQGKKSLREIWDEELNPETVRRLNEEQKTNNQSH